MTEENNGHRTRICIGEQGGVWYVGEGIQEGFFFREYKKHTSAMKVTIYVYCVRKWRGNCPVKGKIIINNGIRGPLILEEVHNHELTPDQEKINEVHQRLMKRAATETVPLKLIYDKELAKESADVGGLRMSYASVFAAMQKRRQRAQPPIPGTILELVKCVRRKMPQWFRTKEGVPYLIAYRENAMLFVSPTTKVLLGENDLLFTMDGTFKVTPTKPKIYQMYTLGAVYCDVFIPIAFGLFQDKTAATYQWMFQELKKLNGDWNPQMLMTDYEMGVISAIQAEFPNARHMGCWFHYSQAIQKKCGNLHLIKAMRVNENLKLTIRKLMALPLLPADWYIKGFEIIEEECQQFLSIEGVRELLHYIRTFWIQRITPSMMSVHEAPVRTNNLQEAFHGNITLHVADSRRTIHPRFWRFLDALQLMERDAHVKFLAAAVGGKVRFPQKKRWIRQHQRIKDATNKFNNDIKQTQEIDSPDIRVILERTFTQTFLERAKYFFNFAEVEGANANEATTESNPIAANLANEAEDDLYLSPINRVSNQVVKILVLYKGFVENADDPEERADDPNESDNREWNPQFEDDDDCITID